MPSNLVSNLVIPGQQWLEEQFEYEGCIECGGGAANHVPVGVLGNWFAYCLSAPVEWAWDRMELVIAELEAQGRG